MARNTPPSSQPTMFAIMPPLLMPIENTRFSSMQ
jgi:hypothetical protein